MMSEGKKAKDPLESEHILVQECRKHLNSVREQGDLCGVTVDVFDFSNDNNPNTFKKGYVYRAATKDRISFQRGAGSVRGTIKLFEPNKAIDARFRTHNIVEKDRLEMMLLQSYSLKHEALLKPLICSYAPSNVVISGVNMFNQSLIDWISCQQSRKASRGSYLSEGEKGMIRSGLEGIEVISNNGYTCDNLADPKSYVVVGGAIARLKILPYNIHPKLPQESTESVQLRLRRDFGTMLKNSISPLWKNDEFDSLISLIGNPLASLSDLFGHPVLSTPGKRLVMYQLYDLMSLAQQNVFNATTVIANWQTSARNHPVLKSILNWQQFDHDATGAFHFGNVVASHYGQHLKKIDLKSWLKGVKPETVDKVLQIHLPLLLCERHNMNCDANFRAA